ncbi:hypothetical protein Tsubulata_047642 [Turnera subulata]|uniref:F-box domain-containing protein n=1 Tax=Turnera subulata TaxID=218843 RepID=A0A9Q0FPQ5_9ROSI|nr:hypothetical protein Tsubulata_047642 [Turnera subulata]
MATSGNLSSSSGSSTSTTSTDNCLLPPEIVEEILSLLPSKPIHRFRSLSKSWSTLLVSLDFHQFRCKSTPPKKTIPRVLRLQTSCSVYDRYPSNRFVISSYYPDAGGFFAPYHQRPAKIKRPTKINVLVMKEYCNEASWVHYVSYTPYNGVFNDAIYLSNSIPRSAKDGRYIILQYSSGCIDVLKWINNNPDEGSDEADEQYSNKIKFYDRDESLTAIPYTEALTSPYASTGIHRSRNS